MGTIHLYPVSLLEDLRNVYFVKLVLMFSLTLHQLFILQKTTKLFIALWFADFSQPFTLNVNSNYFLYKIVIFHLMFCAFFLAWICTILGDFCSLSLKHNFELSSQQCSLAVWCTCVSPAEVSPTWWNHELYYIHVHVGMMRHRPLLQLPSLLHARMMMQAPCSQERDGARISTEV